MRGAWFFWLLGFLTGFLMFTEEEVRIGTEQIVGFVAGGGLSVFAYGTLKRWGLIK